MTHEFKPTEFHATWASVGHKENYRWNMSPLHVVPPQYVLVFADLPETLKKNGSFSGKDTNRLRISAIDE